MKPASAARDTLAKCLQGEVVTLAAETPYGGTDFGETLAAGTELRIEWQGTEVTTFVSIKRRDHWTSPTPVRSSARVGQVIASREPSKDAAAGAKGGGDPSDPLQRGLASLADMPLLGGAK